MKSSVKFFKIIEDLDSIGEADKLIRRLSKELEIANKKNKLEDIMYLQPIIEACKSKLNQLENDFISECISTYSKA